mmetsp:Transcript_10446/g.21245  ORF Transcript_10446/g.21245 Transcript_10446/m.21245 type:complete len:296 (+) Transcript_10446:1584-2471(+)
MRKFQQMITRQVLVGIGTQGFNAHECTYINGDEIQRFANHGRRGGTRNGVHFSVLGVAHHFGRNGVLDFVAQHLSTKMFPHAQGSVIHIFRMQFGRHVTTFDLTLPYHDEGIQTFFFRHNDGIPFKLLQLHNFENFFTLFRGETFPKTHVQMIVGHTFHKGNLFHQFDLGRTFFVNIFGHEFAINGVFDAKDVTIGFGRDVVFQGHVVVVFVVVVIVTGRLRLRPARQGFFAKGKAGSGPETILVSKSGNGKFAFSRRDDTIILVLLFGITREGLSRLDAYLFHGGRDKGPRRLG